MKFIDNVNVSPSIVDKIFAYMQQRDASLSDTYLPDQKREVVEAHLNKWYEGSSLSKTNTLPECFGIGTFGGQKVFAIIEEQNSVAKQKNNKLFYIRELCLEVNSRHIYSRTFTLDNDVTQIESQRESEAVKSDYKPSFTISDIRDEDDINFEEDSVFEGKFIEYGEQHSLTNQSVRTNYIRYINTLYIERDDPDSIGDNEDTLDDICINDDLFGITGFCIKINNKIVPLYNKGIFIDKKDTNSQEYISNILIDNEKIVNLDIFFIQSDYKKVFKKENFDIFSNKVKDLLGLERSQINHNPEVMACSNSIKALLHLLENNAKYFGSLSSFNVHIIYSAWSKDDKQEILNAMAQLSKEIEDHDFRLIESCKVDSEVSGIQELKNLAVANDRGWHPTIQVTESFPLMEKGEDYFAIAVILNAMELLEILLDGETKEEKYRKKKLKKGLFEDNVRDYQGDTKVNLGIRKTIDNDADSFIVLNNGITIIVNSVDWNSRRTQAKLNNPQIVNGCQTCNVIYRAFLDNPASIENVSIIAKIIIINPENKDFADKKTEIVIANNSQNMVHDSTEASRQIHKEIEKWFESTNVFTNEKNKIYYERRSKSLVGQQIKAYQKIRLYDLVQSTVSVWFGQPNLYKIHEDKVIADFKKRSIDVFMDRNDSKRILVFYAAAALFSNFDRLIMEKQIDISYRRAKPQICYLLRNKIHKGFIDINESNNTPLEVSEQIIKLISNEEKFITEVKDSIEKYNKAREIYIAKGNSQFTVFNDEKFCNYLLDQIQGPKISNSGTNRGNVSEFCQVGTVKFVSIRDTNGLPYMFISRPNGMSDIYAAQSTSEQLQFRLCKVGDEVVYKLREDKNSKDGVQAVEVRLLNRNT